MKYILRDTPSWRGLYSLLYRGRCVSLVPREDCDSASVLSRLKPGEQWFLEREQTMSASVKR